MNFYTIVRYMIVTTKLYITVVVEKAKEENGCKYQTNWLSIYANLTYEEELAKKDKCRHIAQNVIKVIQ